ncbi:hypothetical protein [Brachybacterium sacelli]|uniref:Uncharacterized protein n=1 Tax=Brachybacterium sacelli TaxID=173364 RepID=A0ABS4X1B9_9MICO|nr:hypothetical protein [Brachybacterium sacelli]MBP2382136.1 hypothetical protein [Brachybacterium sacelli]
MTSVSPGIPAAETSPAGARRIDADPEGEVGAGCGALSVSVG